MIGRWRSNPKAIAIALCVMVSACESQFARFQRQLGKAQRAEAARLSQMQLPLYIEGEFEEPPPSISVTLEPTRLTLDNALLLHSRISSMAALDRHAFFESAWEIHAGGHPLIRTELPLPLDESHKRQLRTAAHRAREVAEHLSPATTINGTSIVVHAAPGVPFRTIVEVSDLLSLEAGVQLIVARGGRTHAISLNNPPACYTHLDIEGGRPPLPQPDERNLTCIAPRLTLDERGVVVEALAAPWQETKMVSRCAVHGRHARVPAPVMIQNQDGLLSSMSRALSRHWRTLPPCHSAVVRANGSIEWSRIARLLQRLRAIGRHHDRGGGSSPALHSIQLALLPHDGVRISASPSAQ